MTTRRTDAKPYRVQCKNLTFCPDSGRTPVLSGIDVDISPGQFVGVVGSNGAGKSTFLSAVSGELSSYTGMVEIQGNAIKRPVNEVIDGVGVVHQDDRLDLILHLSIAQNISIRQQLGGGPGTSFVSGSWSAAWFRSMRARLGEFNNSGSFELDNIVGNLSGGERQKLSLLIATRLEHEMNPCRLLLLDEHTAKLDHQNAKSLMELTANEVADTGCTAVMVSHRYQDILRHCSRVLVLRQGKVSRDMARPLLDRKGADWLAGEVEAE